MRRMPRRPARPELMDEKVAEKLLDPSDRDLVDRRDLRGLRDRCRLLLGGLQEKRTLRLTGRRWTSAGPAGGDGDHLGPSAGQRLLNAATR